MCSWVRARVSVSLGAPGGGTWWWHRLLPVAVVAPSCVSPRDGTCPEVSGGARLHCWGLLAAIPRRVAQTSFGFGKAGLDVWVAAVHVLTNCAVWLVPPGLLQRSQSSPTSQGHQKLLRGEPWAVCTAPILLPVPASIPHPSTPHPLYSCTYSKEEGKKKEAFSRL